MANIYLVRHGQASFGSENYDQLSGLGLRQCLLLGKWMRQTQQPVDRLIVGELHRQQQSAQAFLEGYGTSPELEQPNWKVESGLNEFDHIQVLRLSRPEFGTAAQLTQFLATHQQPRAVFEKMFDEALLRWMGGEHDSDYAESWIGFQARIQKTMQNLLPKNQEQAEQHTIVFTSAGPITVACQQLLAIPDANLMRLLSVMLNSSVSRLTHNQGQLSLVSINGIAHLEQYADSSLISFR